MAASGGTAGNPAPKATPDTTLNGFTDWKSLYLQRDGILDPWKRRDFNDMLFEYRWKSDWIVNRYVCTVEIRHSQDADDSHTIPELVIAFYDRHSGHRNVMHNVALGGLGGHVVFKPVDCERVEAVFWNKEPVTGPRPK